MPASPTGQAPMFRGAYILPSSWCVSLRHLKFFPPAVRGGGAGSIVPSAKGTRVRLCARGTPGPCRGREWGHRHSLEARPWRRTAGPAGEKAHPGHPFKLLCRKSPVSRGTPGARSCVRLPRADPTWGAARASGFALWLGLQEHRGSPERPAS